MAQSPLRSIAPLALAGFIGAAAVAVYSFVTVAKDGELRRRCSSTCLMRPTYAAADRKAPSFTLSDLDGKKVSLDAYRGKVVVLNLWTLTCGPCKEEMPELADLARILADRPDVAVLAVSSDDDPKEIRATLRGLLGGDAPFTVLHDPDAKITSEAFGTKLFPETYIIDGRGVVRARVDGARAWSNAAVVEYIDQLRGGGYCPVEAKEGRFVGDGAKLCEAIVGG